MFQVADRGLPLPDATSVMHGERLAQTIAARIQASANACISFSDFMRACLYEPSLGYYVAGSTKLGRTGDFTTAPEMSPLFGASIAKALHALAAKSVLELGAGSGALAKAMLAELPNATYQILDLSDDLRDRQRTALDGLPITWINQLPEQISGLVVANEVLDAVPCEIVRFQNSAYERAMVACDGFRFSLRWLPLFQGALFDAAKTRIPPLEGYVSEINLEAEALTRTLAEKLEPDAPSALCFIDYGFPRREFYIPDRASGTLMCHYKHHVHSDALMLPGLQDITAHVDFTAIAEAAVDAGAQVICYTTQAKFLLASGILSTFEQASFTNDSERLEATGALQKLISPTEMGELFKVLIVGNESAASLLDSFSAVDECYRL